MPILNTSGGEGGIRTLETLASLPLFESGAFDHSATSPIVRIPYHFLPFSQKMVISFCQMALSSNG